jgi:hypothetical protein
VKVYRVSYRQEVTGAATVHGSFDLTQDHVEGTHKGDVMTALLDSSYEPTFSTVTGWEIVNYKGEDNGK